MTASLTTAEKPAPNAPATPEGATDQSTLAGTLDEDSTTVESIRADLHELVDGMKIDSTWNENRRNEVERHAWLNGRRRICDLVEVTA